MAACAVCGWRVPPELACDGSSGTHRHHILPVFAGGLDESENIVPLCPNHHAMAHRVFSQNSFSGLYLGPTDRATLIAILQATDEYMRVTSRRTKLLRLRELVATLEALRREREGEGVAEIRERLGRALAFHVQAFTVTSTTTTEA